MTGYLIFKCVQLACTLGIRFTVLFFFWRYGVSLCNIGQIALSICTTSWVVRCLPTFLATFAQHLSSEMRQKRKCIILNVKNLNFLLFVQDQSIVWQFYQHLIKFITLIETCTFLYDSYQVFNCSSGCRWTWTTRHSIVTQLNWSFSRAWKRETRTRKATQRLRQAPRWIIKI